MEGRIKDDLQQKGFDYWYAIVTMDKWLALPPDTPAPIVEAYRAAFAKMYQDREFLERAQKMSEDFEIQFGPDVAKVVKTLGNTPREAVDYISVMLKKQGIGGG
jgi:tripartite-type tricarboxylate transporter receptor subunit TctC